MKGKREYNKKYKLDKYISTITFSRDGNYGIDFSSDNIDYYCVIKNKCVYGKYMHKNCCNCRNCYTKPDFYEPKFIRTEPKKNWFERLFGL